MSPVLLLIATLVVVGLLIAVVFRMGARLDSLRDDLERVRVVQRDMSNDVRTRLEEGARGWESLESDVRPRVEQVEAATADLGASLAESLPALAEVRAHAEEIRDRLAASEARMDKALEAAGLEGQEHFERIEAAVRTLRNAADERLAELAARVAALESDQAYRDEEPPVAEAVGAVAGGTADAARGTRGAQESNGGLWLVVMLVAAAGAVIALATLS